MRKSVRRRPVLETLESMTLLSGLAGVADEVKAAVVAEVRANATGPIVLSGTTRGNYRAGRAPGAPITFNGSGNVSPVGRATMAGSLQLTVLNPTGSLTLSAPRRGRIFATLTTEGQGAPVFYTITGGTKTFDGATGSGQVIVTLIPSGGQAASRGRFVARFVPGQV